MDPLYSSGQLTCYHRSSSSPSWMGARAIYMNGVIINSNRDNFVTGAVHAGYGLSGLNKILACANIPTLNSPLFKRYEREVGPIIEEAAMESCRRAAKEERQLVIDNIDKLCALL